MIRIFLAEKSKTKSKLIDNLIRNKHVQDVLAQSAPDDQIACNGVSDN